MTCSTAQVVSYKGLSSKTLTAAGSRDPHTSAAMNFSMISYELPRDSRKSRLRIVGAEIAPAG